MRSIFNPENLTKMRSTTFFLFLLFISKLFDLLEQRTGRERTESRRKIENELLVCSSDFARRKLCRDAFQVKSALCYNLNLEYFKSQIQILARTKHGSALLLTVLLTPLIHSVVERETKAQTSE